MTLGRVVFLPPNGDNKIQESQGMPATLIQPQGTVQYVHYKGQQPWSPNTSLQKLLKVETKTLGAIQVIIGIMHIGFGAVPIHLFSSTYQPLSAAGGYHIWGGLLFIVSGSLSVAVEKRLNPCLVKCNVGMNIVSAIVALVGIVLCIHELHFNQHTYETTKRYFYDDDPINQWSVGAGLCGLFLLFTLLELFIAVFTVYFRCQAVCYNSNDTDTVALPCTIIGNEMNPNEGNMSSGPMKSGNGNIVIIAPNGAKTIQAGEQIPSTLMHYIRSGGQQNGSLSSQPQQKHCVGALEKIINLEAKTLGVLQIMIGLILFGFGIIAIINAFKAYSPILSTFYPVSSSLFFIASGSVSVSAEKHWNTNLKNASLAMNILSAIVASTSIILYIFIIANTVILSKVLIPSSSESLETSLHTILSDNAMKNRASGQMSIHLAFSILFLILTSLEFCITVIVAHFGCRANCCTDDTAIVYVPCTINGENVIPTEKKLASLQAV
ncbi:uncharacterized protein [Anolis sagrei]|uniref:uncharacterized protein isoform X2 n=1 Tax=Anolis sagrei TaxID=38937 RepID=UPI003522CBE8